MKKIIFIIGVILLPLFTYHISSTVKFYTHFGIWLPSFCYGFKFTENPNFTALLGMDGLGAQANFEIEKKNIQNLIKAIKPQNIWIKYSESAPDQNNITLDFPSILQKKVLEGKFEIMLYSGDTKGDYYNIWLIPKKNNKIKVSISMPFT